MCMHGPPACHAAKQTSVPSHEMRSELQRTSPTLLDLRSLQWISTGTADVGTIPAGGQRRQWQQTCVWGQQNECGWMGTTPCLPCASLMSPCLLFILLGTLPIHLSIRPRPPCTACTSLSPRLCVHSPPHLAPSFPPLSPTSPPGP